MYFTGAKAVTCSVKTPADIQSQMHDRGRQLLYLGFDHWGELVPTDTLCSGKKDFNHVEKERPVLVTNNNPAPPDCFQLQGSFLPSPSYCQVITVHGGNTGHRLSRGQKFWAAASNVTRESKRHRTTGAEPLKGPRGSCQLQPLWVSFVITSAGTLLKARDCMQQGSIKVPHQGRGPALQ